MALRPAKCYKKLERPNTRQSIRKPKKSYVKGVPQVAITKFEMGDPKKEFSKRFYLVSKQAVQIRDNALESIRITMNKILENKIGKGNFFFKILVYPHHVLRENPLATGAGADRFQTGMRKSFGKPIGTAARVRVGQNLVELRINKEVFGKKILKIASSKLPTTCKIVEVK